MRSCRRRRRRKCRSRRGIDTWMRIEDNRGAGEESEGKGRTEEILEGEIEGVG